MRSRGAGGAGGDYLKGGKEATDRGWSRGAGGFGNLALVFCRVHLALLRGRADRDGAEGSRIVLCAFRASKARGVSGGIVIPAVSRVEGRGGAAVRDWPLVTLFGAGWAGAAVFRLLVIEGPNRANGMVVLANGSSVAVPLAVAAAGGFISRVSDLDLPFL